MKSEGQIIITKYLSFILFFTLLIPKALLRQSCDTASMYHAFSSSDETAFYHLVTENVSEAPKYYVEKGL